MDINTIWFILIGTLFCGFFFLEGFDYGIGILLPFLAKKDVDKRIMKNTIGPVWDGNEMWMILAGGALFATFPHWYATFFSGFYIFMFAILFALILRNVTFEFRDTIDNTTWRNIWDGAFFIGSLLPAFLWGLILTNFIVGVPIDANKEFVGTFSDLIHPVALLGGLISLLVFTFHGTIYLQLKTEDDLLNRSKKASLVLGVIVIAVEVLALILLSVQGNQFAKPLTLFASVAALLALVLSYLSLKVRKCKTAMLLNGLNIVLTVIALFSSLYPRVMVSSLKAEYSLTVINAASSPYSLRIITICAVIMLPIIIAYQAWTYWIFRKRVNSKNLEY